jgi:hypothetical protein
MIPFLERNGFTVRVEESTAIYTDSDYLATVDLILQIVTMSTVEKDEFAGLLFDLSLMELCPVVHATSRSWPGENQSALGGHKSSRSLKSAP